MHNKCDVLESSRNLPPTVEKLSPMKPVPGAKTVRDRCLKLRQKALGFNSMAMLREGGDYQTKDWASLRRPYRSGVDLPVSGGI